MSQPVLTIGASQPAAPVTSIGNAFSSFIDDLDQFIFKDNNNNDMIFSNMPSYDDSTFKNFLSTSPSNSCSSLLNNNLLNPHEFDLFKFDKGNSSYSSNGLFDIYQYGENMTNYNNTSCGNNINSNILNLNHNSANSQNDEDETESDEDHSIVQNFMLQDQELDTDQFHLDDNEHMINGFGMISMANTMQAAASLSNNDALVTIRDLACQEKKMQGRKHKNSTSSTASVSRSSTIKKVAIELQNSTANLVSQSFIESAVPAQNSSQQQEQGHHMPSSENNQNFDFNDDNDLEDLLGLDGWEQMLNEDCMTIDFSTTNFNTLNSGNTSSNNTKNIVGSQVKLTTIATSHINSPTTITTYNNKLPVLNTTTLSTNKGITQTSRLVPHISTMSSQGNTNNKCNQPLVLVLSNSNSSAINNNNSPASRSITEHKLKTTSSPSLTPIASPMGSQLKKLNTTRIAPTTIISTSKPSSQQITATTTANNVKKLNSVILSDTNSQIKAEPLTATTNNNSKPLISTFSSNNKNSTIKLTNGTKMSGPTITNTTSKTITTRQVPLTLSTNTFGQSSIKSYRVNSGLNNQQTNSLGLSATSAHNSSLCSSASSSPNLSPTSSTSSSSLIDYCEISNCVNPDQIFPYRLPLMRFVKTENEANKADNWTSGYSNQNGYEDDEEEEEIDVVNVHTNNSLTVQNLNFDQQTYLPTAPVNVSNNSNIKANNNSTSNVKTTKAKKSSKNSNNTSDSNHSDQSNLNTKGSSKQSNGRKSSSATNKKNNNTNKQSTTVSATTVAQNVITGNTNQAALSNNSSNNKITQLNSIRILTTTTNNASSSNNSENLRQLNTTSISKTPTNNTNPSMLKLSNNYNPSTNSASVILHKEISSSLSSITNTTKYITMAPSKLQPGMNIKCQTITPTISSNKPKIVSATNNNSLISFSSLATNAPVQPLNTANLKFNVYNNGNCTNSNSNNAPTTTSSFITTLKIPTSLTKINKKFTGKAVKVDDGGVASNCSSVCSSSSSIGGGVSLVKNSNTSTGTNSSAMLTEDDEFYYDDDEFAKGLTAIGDFSNSNNISNKAKPMSFKITGDNSLCLNGATNKNFQNQFHSVKCTDDDLDDYMNDDIDDDLDDDIDDDIDDEDDDECSTSSSSSSPSPLTSGSSSGFSTPTKASKLKAELSDKPDNFDINNLNEKLSKKPKKMTSSGSFSLSSGSSTSLSQSSKRNSRLSSIGYSSDNPAEKRAFHILSERQRRNDLKKLFETLRTNIPTLCDKQKASKLTILKAAVDHLCEVSNKKEKLTCIYDKEKARHAQLMQHLKSLQQQSQSQQQQQHHYNYQTVQANGQSALAVH